MGWMLDAFAYWYLVMPTAAIIVAWWGSQKRKH